MLQKPIDGHSGCSAVMLVCLYVAEVQYCRFWVKYAKPGDDRMQELARENEHSSDDSGGPDAV